MLLTQEDQKNRIAKRIAQEVDKAEGLVFINTGVGIPTMVPSFINNPNVIVQAENGMLGVGPLAEGDQLDSQIINAGRQPVIEKAGCSYFDSATSFGMIRGGHIDATVIGAFEVDEKANVANWIIPNGKQLGVGGAMDLVTGANKVIIAMQHISKDNKSKIKKACTLPITGLGEVDMIVTEYAVFAYPNGKMTLLEIAPDISMEDLRSITEADFAVSTELKIMQV